MHINQIISKARKVFNEIKGEYETASEDQQIEHEKQEQTQKFKIEKKRIERFDAIKENDQKTFISIAEIDMKLGHFEQLEDSEDLKDALTHYKRDADAIFREKNLLILKIKDDLQTAEEYYISGISRFHIEFEQVVINGKTHFDNCRQKSLEQLIEVEMELLAERTKILEKNKKELGGLFEAHEKAEHEFMKYREGEEERNFKEITQIRQDRNREFSELKLVLETEIQNHEKCLEDMKAIYQLNQEKLTYNFKVLTEKKEENTALAMILRKKERFFLNLLKKKNDDFFLKDTEFRKNNNKLTDQSKTITKQYRELHKKFEHFEKTDTEKYEQIKEIALKSINELKNKIINCNQIVMNQQLGLTVKLCDADQQNLSSLNLDPQDSTNQDKILSIKQLEERSRSSVQSSKVRNSARNSGQEASHLTDENNNLKNINSNFSEDEKSKLIELVLSQTEFLLDDKIISEIDGLTSEQDKMLRRLDLLMKIFSIKTYNEANDWLFKMHLQCLGFEDQCYDEDLIILTISRLLEAKKKTEINPVDSYFGDEDNRNKQSSKNENKEKTFWKNVSKVLDEETLDIWKILDRQLAKYYELLKLRKETSLSNEATKRENTELKKLLEQYMQQEVLLIYPPKV